MKLCLSSLVVVTILCRTAFEFTSRVSISGLLFVVAEALLCSRHTLWTTLVLVFLGTFGRVQPLPTRAMQQQILLRLLITWCTFLCRTM